MPSFTIEDHRFPSGQDTCHAWLYRPDSEQKRPVIIMAHGLGGVKRAGLPNFAQRFSEAGYACLVFDYRYFGESGGEPREWLDIPSQLADWDAAITYAKTLTAVDTNRIVLWGTSFGGGHVIVTAARHPEITAAISQCPFTDGLSSVFAINMVTNAKLAALGVRDKISSWLGKEPVRVDLVGKPGTTALMTSEDSLQGYNAIKDSTGATDVPERITARIGLQLLTHQPGKWARKVRCPILFNVCEHDSVAPAGPTLKYAAQAPRGIVNRYPYGHFDIYVGEAFETNIRDQLNFLSSYVPISGPS